MAKYFDPAFKVTVNGSALTADLSGEIKDISVIHQADNVDQFSFTLVNKYPKMRWTHTADRDLFRIGSTVAIEMGYVNDMHKMIDGEILKLKPSFPDREGPTLVIEGQSLFNRLQRTKEPQNHLNKTYKEIVEKVVQAAGGTVGLTAKAEDPKDKDNAVAKTTIQETVTAWELIFKLARQVAFDVFFDGKTLIFHKPKEESETTLEYGKSLKSFKATLDLKNQVSKVIVATSIVDWATGMVTAGVAPITKALSPGSGGGAGGGGKTAAELADEWLGVQAYDVRYEPALSQQEADNKAQAIYNEQLGKACTGDVTSIGLPALRAGKFVKLQGIGVFFSGDYKIMKSTHTLDANGYLTTLSVARWRF